MGGVEWLLILTRSFVVQVQLNGKEQVAIRVLNEVVGVMCNDRNFTSIIRLT